jgi:hypothetical protein
MRPLSDFEFLNWLGNLRETIVIIAMISFAGSFSCPLNELCFGTRM